MIARRTPLRRSTRPIARKAPIRRRYPLKAKTGRRQPEALDSWRRAVARGHEKWRLVVYCKEPSGICPMCFKRSWTDAAHIFPKGRYPHIRLDPENGVPACRPCHRIFDTDHELKVRFATQYLGPDGYERLRLRAISRGKTDVRLALMYLDRELERLRSVIDRMGRGRGF